MDISVVIPAKNESQNISALLDQLTHVAEVLVVSGVDYATQAIVSDYPNARFVLHNVPGKGEAMRVGIAAAAHERIMCMDADGSHAASELDRAWEAFELNAGVVKGSRVLGGSDDLTPLRRFGNYWLTCIYNMLYNQGITDLCYGYIGATREALDKLGLDAVGFEIEAQFMARAALAGYTVHEFESYEYERASGTSNLRPFRDGFRILYTIVRNK